MHTTTPQQKLSSHDLRRLSVEAVCDPRTAKRYLDGLPVAIMTEARIKAALARLSLEVVR